MDDEQKAVEARFLDLAWAGEEGMAKYPGFLNGRVDWPLAEPDGQHISQELDKTQLTKSIDLCRAAKAKAKSRRSVAPAAQAQQGLRATFRQAADRLLLLLDMHLQTSSALLHVTATAYSLLLHLLQQELMSK